MTLFFVPLAKIFCWFRLRDIEKSQLSQWHDRLEALQALIKDMNKDLNNLKLHGNTKSAMQQVQVILRL